MPTAFMYDPTLSPQFKVALPHQRCMHVRCPISANLTHLARKDMFLSLFHRLQQLTLLPMLLACMTSINATGMQDSSVKCGHNGHNGHAGGTLGARWGHAGGKRRWVLHFVP